MVTKRIFKFMLLCIWVVVVTWFTYIGNGNSYGIDDADIFFAYASNLANGNGIVYSTGIPPVEGYTSTLWMLATSIVFLVGWDEKGVLVLTVIIFTITQLLVLRIIDKIFPKDNASFCKILYIFLISASFGYLSWTTVTLMDTSLWSLIIVLMTYVLLFNPVTIIGWIIASTPFVLAPIARPEAILIAPAIIGLLSIKLKSENRSMKPAAFLLGAVLVATVLLTAFRMFYFGHPLPNTYYAKVSPSLVYNFKGGVAYFYKFVSQNTLANLTAVYAVFFGIWFFRNIICNLMGYRLAEPGNRGNDYLGNVSIIIIIFLVIPFATGGDHFQLSRFYQPIYPLMCLAFVFIFAKHILNGSAINYEMALENRILSIVGMFVIALWLGLFLMKDSWFIIATQGSPIGHEFAISSNGKKTGEHLNSIFSYAKNRYPSVGVLTAGGISRTYKGTVYDLMGLNNEYIAHFPGDRIGIKNHAAFEKEAFFNLPIDILTESPDNGFAQTAFKGLFVDERFIKEWSYGNLSLINNPGLNYTGFINNAYLEMLIKSGEYVFLPTKAYNYNTAKWDSKI